MTDATEWRGQVGESWAAQWRRTDRSFGALTEHLLARTREFSFDTVLDIGCGAGELSLAIARGRPHVAVSGVDISEPLVAAARERASHLPNVAFTVADAARWQPETRPQLLVSRHGVMFFDDPGAAFAHFAQISAPGAGLMFSCFRDVRENPFFSELGRLLPRGEPPGDPHAPGPFAFADPTRVEGILAGAGWRDIAFEPFDFAMIAGAGDDPVEDAINYFSTIGPAARAAREMGPDERERFFARVRELAARNRHDSIVSLRAGVWVVTARAPA